MGRKPGTVCTTCGNVGTRAEMKRDGGDGYCHKEPCGGEAKAAAPTKIQCAISPECESQNEHGGPCIPRPPLRAERAPASPPTNRRGKPATVASEAARTCRVRGCGCTAAAPCDLGAGRTCSWMSAEPPAEGDTCSLCASLIEAAAEAHGGAGTSTEGLAAHLFEDCDAPALGESIEAAGKRLGACIEIAVARTKPTKKDRPAKKKAHPLAGLTPAQAVLPGSEVARTLTLPTAPPVVQLPAEDRGTCSACGEKMTRENSSRLPSDVVVHVGCATIELSAPCSPCDASRGEPCAWATAEPASYVHPARVRLLSAEQQREIANRATADRIRALCDRYAGLASVHPMPTRGAVLRAITSDGTPEALAADVFGALCERGEIVGHREDEDTYYRRAPGSPPVVMGRVGVKVVSGSITIDGATYDGEARDPRGAGMREADRPALEAALADPEVADGAAAMLDAMGPPVACVGCGDPATTPAGPGRSPVCDDCAPSFTPPPDLADARALSPAERMLVATSEIVRAAEEARVNARACLAAEVAARAAVEQLDAVQRERDEEKTDAAKLRAEVGRLLSRVEMSDAAERQARAELAQGPIDLSHWMRKEAEARAEIVTLRAQPAARSSDAAETAIRDLAEALGVTLGASPAETCAAVAKKTIADVALAKDLARLAQIETSERTEEAHKLRKGLSKLYEQHSGEGAPADDADLIGATKAKIEDLLQDAASEAEDQQRLAVLSSGRVIALRAGIVGMLGDPLADPASLDDADLLSVLRSDRAPELDGAVAAAVLDLTGETPPMGQGVAPLAQALGEAVRAVLAERAAAREPRKLVVATATAAPVGPTPAGLAAVPRRPRSFE